MGTTARLKTEEYCYTRNLPTVRSAYFLIKRPAINPNRSTRFRTLSISCPDVKVSWILWDLLILAEASVSEKTFGKHFRGLLLKTLLLRSTF